MDGQDLITEVHNLPGRHNGFSHARYEGHPALFGVIIGLLEFLDQQGGDKETHLATFLKSLEEFGESATSEVSVQPTQILSGDPVIMLEDLCEVLMKLVQVWLGSTDPELEQSRHVRDG